MNLNSYSRILGKEAFEHIYEIECMFEALNEATYLKKYELHKHIFSSRWKCFANFAKINGFYYKDGITLDEFKSIYRKVKYHFTGGWPCDDWIIDWTYEDELLALGLQFKDQYKVLISTEDYKILHYWDSKLEEYKENKEKENNNE